MTPPRRRSVVALAAPVVVAMLALGPLAAAVLPGTAAVAADASTAPIQVKLSSLTPIAPQPDDTLTLTGTLTNVSAGPVTDLGLELEVSPLIDAQSEFDSYASDPDGSLDGFNMISATFSPIPAEETTLEPAESEPFSLSLDLNAAQREHLALPDAWQVRELGIAVTGTANLLAGSVGQLRTFLPWAPRNAPDVGYPTQLAWVWPLVDRPHRTATGTWFSDTLNPELGPTGRLTGLLNAANAAEDQSPLGHKPTTQNVPVTWVIDPMLLSEVEAMSAGYRVQTATGTVAGTGAAAAKEWLTNLRTAVTRTDASVISLPYADPDVVAAARAGGFTTTIGLATTTGSELLQRALPGVAPPLQYGWPANGFADQRSIDLLRATGDNTLILSDNAVPVLGVAPSETPSAHTVLTTDEGQVPTLLSDAGLDADVESGINSPDGTRLSLQEFLAETLMIQAEGPGDRRYVVVTPNRRWDPAPSYAAALVADTGKVPWVHPVSLEAVRDSPPYTKVERQPLTYPAAARRAELSPGYLALVSKLRGAVSLYSAILPQGTPAIASYTIAEEQALSSAWRDQQKIARAQLATVTASVRALLSQVHITSVNKSYVTLTSHGGKVPVTISNNLDTAVSVVVHVATNQRLTLSNGGRVTVTIPPHQQTAVEVHAAAKTSGVFPLQVQLFTPKGQGKPYGQSVTLYVRSTAYGTITLVITGAATAALMIAVAIRLTRRALAARRPSVVADT
jgi:uncharacterized protein DUF6049